MLKRSLFLLATVLWLYADKAEGLCCPWVLTADFKCACDDGGLVHPWECCATGGCNVFCCNCAGDCRKNKTIDDLVSRPKREALNNLKQTGDYFSAVDTNGDGALSLAETRAFLSLRKHLPAAAETGAPDWFADMDDDGDGAIQPAEFDELLIEDY